MTSPASTTTAGATEPFARLQAAYDDRMAAAIAARRAGERVVGYVGNTVPVELILAAGCIPVRIAPTSGSTRIADKYVEPISDPDVRFIFEDYVEGRLDVLDLLIIPRSTESYHKLFLALREAWRTGIVGKGPELWLYDILHTQRASSRAYGLARTRELAVKLGAVTDASLSRAIVATNETRSLLGRLQALRIEARRPASGAEAQVATGASRFMRRGEYNELLENWLDGAAMQRCSGPRLLVKGVPLEHAELHRLIEDEGAVVVQEDDDWGSRAASPLIDAEAAPLEAAFDYYYREVPCPRIHPFDLERSWFARALEERHAQGVVFYLPRPDDIHGWTFPAERALVNAAGIPWVLVRDDARDATCRPAISEAIRTLIRKTDHG